MSEVSSEAVERVMGEFHECIRAERDGTYVLVPVKDLRVAYYALAAHQPARVVPSAEDIEQVIYKTLYESGASFESATVVPAVREAVLALFASQPTVAEVAQIKAERDAAQEHLRYHLADFRPLADGNMSGDLAVDMAAYASRLKADLEEARAALASQPTVAQVRQQVARELADQREAFLSSPGLDPAWIAGRHSAVDHVAARIARGETKGGE